MITIEAIHYVSARFILHDNGIFLRFEKGALII